MKICDYGCGKESNFTFKNSNNCCSKSSSSCDGMKKTNSKNVRKFIKENGGQGWKNGHPKGFKGKKSPFEGLSYVERYGEDKAAQVTAKISKKLKDLPHNWDLMSNEQQDIIRANASKRILVRYENGWMPKAGRCKKFTYESSIAGSVSLDGTWELQTAKWLDANVISWKRNTTRFPYTDVNGKHRHYTPDFWVDDWQTFIEVKGYETQLDRSKWSQFPEKLIVWKKKELLDKGILGE